MHDDVNGVRTDQELCCAQFGKTTIPYFRNFLISTLKPRRNSIAHYLKNAILWELLDLAGALLVFEGK
jgi:hypothetical protein